jgi:WD40 repeat protein
MDEPARTAAKRILLRLAAPGDGPEAVAQQVPIVDLDLDHDEDGRRAIAVLTEARLVTVANPVVEVAHEALLRDWPRLHAWLEDDVQGRNLHRHLMDAARNWDEGDRDDADLYRGARLTATLEWAEEHKRDPNELERSFLAASKTASEGEAARARRTNRRLRGLLVGVAVFLVVAIVAGGVACGPRQRADGAATTALAQSIGAQAVSEQHLDLAMLLAREAVNLDPSLATRSDLLATLLRAPTVIRTFHPPPSYGRILALSPDGTLLAFGPFDDVSIVRTDTGKQIGTTFASASDGYVAFGPDDRLLRVVGPQNRHALAVTDPRTGDVTRRILPPRPVDGSSLITSIVFDPAGVRMAVRYYTWSKFDYIAQFDYTTGRLVAPIIRVPSVTTPAGQPVSDMTYSEDGRRLLAFGKGLEVFDARSGSIVQPFPQAGAVVGALSSDGHTVALGQADGSIRFFDTRTGSMVTGLGTHGATVTAVRFSLNGKVLISGGRDGTLLLWDVGSHKVFASLNGQAPEAGIGLAGPALPDGSVFYTMGFGIVNEWDLSGSASLGRTVMAGVTHPSQYQSGTLAVSPDSSTFAVGSTTGKVYLRDVETLRSKGSFQGLGGERTVESLSWSPDGRFLLVAGDDPAGGPSEVRLWRVKATPTLVRTMQPALGHLWSAAYGPGGTTVAASGSRPGRDPKTQGEVAEWDAATGRLVAPPTVVKGGRPHSITYAPSGIIAAAVGCGDRVGASAMVNAITGTVEQHVDTYGACAAAYSPDGSSLATVDWGGDLQLWDAGTGAPTGQNPPALSGGLTSVAWSPDGRTIATVDWRGNVRLTDVATGQQIGVPFVAWNGPLLSTYPPTRWAVAQFTPDGLDLVVSDDSGRAWVFPLNLQAWEDRACQVANRSFTTSEWQQFVPDRPYESVCSPSA